MAASRQEEWSWIERARAGDQQAFRLLVERHRDRAYGLALRILRSSADAEDAAQEAFVRAWQALPGFRSEAGFSTWLYRIVAHQSFDRLEQLKRRRERETAIDRVAEPAAEAPPPGALTRILRLERIMDALTPVQRAAVTLYYWQDRSVEEVAAALGIPENTVKTHLSRARAELRERWTRMEHDEPRS
ncbi:MAG: RNA polymerase sigma factor [Candidatus Eiseniibacteriota bacterium]